MTTLVAVVCALAASLMINYSMYMQKKAVDTLPAVEFKIDWDVTKAFATNLPWVGALVLMLLGGGVYAVALALAPVSIVQPVLGSGVALLAWLAIRNLGEKPRRIDLYAIGATILGVILIGVSLVGYAQPKVVHHRPLLLWVFTAVVVAVAVAVPLLTRGRKGSGAAAGLGVSVGLLMGLAAIFGRLLLLDWQGQWAAKGLAVLFASVFVIAWAATLLPGFVMLQAALQRGMAVVVVPIVAGLSQLIPIVGGMIALREPFPPNLALSVLRVLGFTCILVATVVLSRRAEETAPTPVTVAEEVGVEAALE